jgi:hypothetical protein
MSVYLLKHQQSSSSYFGYVKIIKPNKPVSMVFGFRTKKDALRSRHILTTHQPVEFNNNVLILSKVSNPTLNPYSTNIELYIDDLKDFTEYVSSFNTRLQLINEIVVQPDTIKMVVSQRRAQKFDKETMAFNLELIYEVPSDMFRE